MMMVMVMMMIHIFTSFIVVLHFTYWFIIIISE